MSGTVFELDAFNAVIVGNGALGSAMLEALLGYAGLQRVFVLARNFGSSEPEQHTHNDGLNTQGTAGHNNARVSRLSFDAEDPSTIASAAAQIASQVDTLHLVFNTVGLLHDAQHGPEKRLQNLKPDHLLRSFQINALVLPLLAQHFSKLMKHTQPAILASLSARVGSIADNNMGGWYSYRASKAAHNMLLRTIALEWRTSHRNASVVALHPGTVRSRLSEPFLTPRYKNTVLTPAESATCLLGVMRQLSADTSGVFLDWNNQPIDW